MAHSTKHISFISDYIVAGIIFFELCLCLSAFEPHCAFCPRDVENFLVKMQLAVFAIMPNLGLFRAVASIRGLCGSL